MVLNLPDDLAPDAYPLAWLVGTWRGFGMVGYPNVPESPFVQELTFDHDGGPYLRAHSTIWLATTRSGTEIHQELRGVEGVERLERGQLWSTQTEYWRPTGTTGVGVAREGAPSVPTTGLEVFTADPAGYAMLFVGEVTGARINLATDAVMRSATGAEIAGATRMYGLVRSELMWAEDLAAFGEELQSYASARLTRLDDADPGAGEDGAPTMGETA